MASLHLHTTTRVVNKVPGKVRLPASAHHQVDPLSLNLSTASDTAVPSNTTGSVTISNQTDAFNAVTHTNNDPAGVWDDNLSTDDEDRNSCLDDELESDDPEVRGDRDYRKWRAKLALEVSSLTRMLLRVRHYLISDSDRSGLIQLMLGFLRIRRSDQL
jgi:hypothetical protein